MSSARFSLDAPPFASLTGAGVRVAVIDSGVFPGNPHIGTSVSGVRIHTGGEIDDDFVDQIGHGTAVAAAILEKAPGIELLAVRVFDRTLATSANALAEGIKWAAANGARLVNLSLGTSNPARAAMLGAAVDDAMEAGAIVVAARESGGVTWLPGSLPTVAGVRLDPSCERNELGVSFGDWMQPACFTASGYPRPIPGVPAERNLSGISFAVANVTGFLSRLLEADDTVRDVSGIARMLRAGVLESLDITTFAGRVGEVFLLVPDETTVIVTTLIAVTPAPGGSAGRVRAGGRTPFSLVLRSPPSAPLPQRIYRLQHDELGALDLFLVPIGPDDAGMCYEAVFS